MSPRARSLVVRTVIGLVVVAAIALWLRSRSQAADPPGRGGGSSAGSGAGAPAGGGSGDRVVPVKTAAAAKQDLPMWLEGLGSVAAFQQVTVRSQVDGRLDQVLFTEGQPVKRGDVLAQVDPRPFVVALHQAEGALARDQANRKNAATNYERYKSLREQNLVAQQQVDDFASQVGQADGAIAMDRAQVENARLQLDYARITSPIDGVTGTRQVDQGNLVHPSDASGIVIVTQLEPAAVNFSVAQDELPRIARAMAAGEVQVEARSRDGQTLLGVGKAAVIDNQINPSTSTLKIKALVPNPQHLLWPGEFVKARMLVETIHDAVVVPSVAVQRGPQGAFVYVVGADQIAQMKPVEVGASSGDLTVVTKGVAAGDQVVVEGANQLRPGARVDVARDGGGGGAPPGKGRGKRDGARAPGAMGAAASP